MSDKSAININLSAEELAGLKQRIQQRTLSTSDVDVVLSFIEAIVTLKTLLAKRRFAILSWLRKIFGLKTEKVKREDYASVSEEKPKGNGRRGRNGRDDYPGAKKTFIKHESCKAGDECPECKQGKLRQAEPAVDYDWQGHSPITLHVFLLERFVCHICKMTFTATSPVATTAKTVDDSKDLTKVGRCDRNARANAIVAILRFWFGVAHYRLAKIQGAMGIGLPVASQYRMVKQVYSPALSVYEHLICQAAEGALFYADDTAIKILDWLAGKGPPTLKNTPRKRAQTSAIISRSADGRSIVLYLTGALEAGKNLTDILRRRDPDLGAPLYMCDGLAANAVAGDCPVIALHCLDHARRAFFDLRATYSQACDYVLSELALIYKADKEAKAASMDAKTRLLYHQKHSRHVMERLGRWMVTQLQTEAVEENSDLGKAINYCLKRWTAFNEFHHIEGVPLSNADCERAIKSVITHRKNSLFYKTENGAHVGDVIQSLIATCEQASVNCFEYLEWLQINKSAVLAHPERFAPWCHPQP